jgi:hypothetical protein
MTAKKRKVQCSLTLSGCQIVKLASSALESFNDASGMILEATIPQKPRAPAHN